MSKRKLLQLVAEKIVTGWDDPRMPTISGLRRRGVTAGALRHFAYNIGITKCKRGADPARAGTRHPGGFKPAGPAAAGRAAPAESCLDKLSRGQGGGTPRCQ